MNNDLYEVTLSIIQKYFLVAGGFEAAGSFQKLHPKTEGYLLGLADFLKTHSFLTRRLITEGNFSVIYPKSTAHLLENLTNFKPTDKEQLHEILSRYKEWGQDIKEARIC